MNGDILLTERKGSFEFRVSYDLDFELGHYTQYCQSRKEADKIVDKFENGVWAAYCVEKYDLCPHCNQADQIVEALGDIIAESPEEALKIYISQQAVSV